MKREDFIKIKDPNTAKFTGTSLATTDLSSVKKKEIKMTIKMKI